MRNLGLPDEEQAEGFVGGEAGEAGLEAVEQLDPAARAARGEDRGPGLTERFDVTQHRSFRHLERVGELPCGHAAAPLEHQQHVEHARGTHR